MDTCRSERNKHDMKSKQPRRDFELRLQILFPKKMMFRWCSITWNYEIFYTVLLLFCYIHEIYGEIIVHFRIERSVEYSKIKKHLSSKSVTLSSLPGNFKYS